MLVGAIVLLRASALGETGAKSLKLTEIALAPTPLNPIPGLSGNLESRSLPVVAAQNILPVSANPSTLPSNSIGMAPSNQQPGTESVVPAGAALFSWRVSRSWGAIEKMFLGLFSSQSSDFIGEPFKPGQRVGIVQIGVDPRTLIPSKNLSQPETKRLKNAEAYRDVAVSVTRSGRIRDGHHRVKNAIKKSWPVDVSIDQDD